jgi:L-lactate utilization protein LutC
VVPPDHLMGRFRSALSACGGSSTVVSAQGLADAVAAVVGRQGLVLVGPGLESLAGSLLAKGVDARPGLSQRPGADETIFPEPDCATGFADAASAATCGLTTALMGIAESGTIVVDTSSGNAGLLSCLPPHHVAVLPARSILPSLADALEILAGKAAADGAGFVLISGPSRTSDIEMMSVLGVHGPLRLDVVIVREDA